MLERKAAERIIKNVYPLLYFRLPRAPSRLAPNRLNERQISILWLIERGSLNVGEIAEKIHLGLSQASKLVSNLENKGLVKNSRFSSDKCRVDVGITVLGKERLDGEKEKRIKWFEKLFHALDEIERRALVILLEKISVKSEKAV